MTFKSVQAAGELFLLPAEPPVDVAAFVEMAAQGPDHAAAETEIFLRSMLGPDGWSRLVDATEDGRLDVLDVVRLVTQVVNEYVPVPEGAIR